MNKVSGSTVIKTPAGLQVPLFLYAAAISILIAAGSAVGMYSMNYPWWVWIIEALILLPIAYAISRNLTEVDDAGNYAIVSKPKVIGFATIAAIVFALLIIELAMS